MVTTPVFYQRLDAPGSPLDVEPAAASWDKAGSPGQLRSAAFIEDVRRQTVAGIRATPGPVAVRLDIGLEPGVALTTLNDLDNYAFPLVPRLADEAGRNAIAAAWVTKRHAPYSSVAVGPAIPAEDPGGLVAVEVRTTASASTQAYKKQIRDQIRETRPLPDGPVALQLAFVVGPARAWPNLWKATIDALGALLGRGEGAGEWNARDGRITDLGLHGVVDQAAGTEVTIAIRATPAS